MPTRTRIAAVPAALLLLAACSSSSGTGPQVPLTRLRTLLVTAGDVGLPGYRVDTPSGEQQSRTATATRYFTATDGSVQLVVTLVATPSVAAARAASSAALATVATSLRATTRSAAVRVGRDGRELAGRTKGDGALQDTVGFVEGSVAVAVTVSSPGAQPPSVALAVARAQDARLSSGR